MQIAHRHHLLFNFPPIRLKSRFSYLLTARSCLCLIPGERFRSVAFVVCDFFLYLSLSFTVLFLVLFSTNSLSSYLSSGLLDMRPPHLASIPSPDFSASFFSPFLFLLAGEVSYSILSSYDPARSHVDVDSLAFPPESPDRRCFFFFPLSPFSPAFGSRYIFLPMEIRSQIRPFKLFSCLLGGSSLFRIPKFSSSSFLEPLRFVARRLVLFPRSPGFIRCETYRPLPPSPIAQGKFF